MESYFDITLKYNAFLIDAAMIYRIKFNSVVMKLRF
jgi:hypothetical protein